MCVLMNQDFYSVDNSTFYVPTEYSDPFYNNRTKIKAFKYILNEGPF